MHWYQIWPCPKTGKGQPRLFICANLVWSSFQSKKVGNDQESIPLSTTPDPGYHMEK